ncbi:MAG: NAD(P)-binding domain-containing protein [Pseudomonadota bacterium]
MADITIIGSGVMGTSIAVPALDNGHHVTLVGSPLDDDIIETMRAGEAHPKLDRPLTGKASYLRQDEMTADHLQKADVVLLGVSSAGMPWILDYLLGFGVPIVRLMMITKGLDVTEDGGVRTLPPRLHETLAPLGDPPAVIGVGGPCIARELSNRAPTAVVFGHDNRDAAVYCQRLFETEYYHIRPNADLIGVEANAPLKNFMAIGVAATWSRYPDRFKDDARQMNPTAAVFEQAVHELALLTQWLGGNPMTAMRLAGAGDLFVTVNAGRNSRLGLRLGAGDSVLEALNGPLAGETVEGVDTGRALGPGLYKAWQKDPVLAAEMPLTRALLNAILHEQSFSFDMGAYWHRGD